MTSLPHLPPLWRESRMGLELATLMRDPVFRGEGIRDGRGRPALLIPGFMAGDESLAVMARWLRGIGHEPGRAGIRVNVGCSGALADRLETRLEGLVQRQGQPATIIGHSRGGMLAKVLACRRPDLVAGIVTLGSPTADPLSIHPFVRGAIEAVALLGRAGVPGLLTRRCLEDDCCRDFWTQVAGPLPSGVGYHAVYSRTDGIVSWRHCLDPAAEHHEVHCSHCGMPAHPGVFRAVAEALDAFAQVRPPHRTPSAACSASAHSPAPPCAA